MPSTACTLPLSHRYFRAWPVDHVMEPYPTKIAPRPIAPPAAFPIARTLEPQRITYLTPHKTVPSPKVTIEPVQGEPNASPATGKQLDISRCSSLPHLLRISNLRDHTFSFLTIPEIFTHFPRASRDCLFASRGYLQNAGEMRRRLQTDVQMPLPADTVPGEFYIRAQCARKAFIQDRYEIWNIGQAPPSSDICIDNRQSGERIHTLQGQTKEDRLVMAPGLGMISSTMSISKFWDLDTGGCLSSAPMMINDSDHFEMIPEVGIAYLHFGVRIWNAKTNTHTPSLPGTCPLRWIPNTGLVVNDYQNHSMRMIDPAMGECIRTFIGHTKQILAILWDSQIGLISRSDDGTIKTWDPHTASCLRTFTMSEHNSSPYTHTVVVIPPYDLAAIREMNDPTVIIFDSRTGETKRILNERHSFFQLSWAPELGLVSSSFDDTLRIWNPYTGECLKVINTQCKFNIPSWMPNIGLTFQRHLEPSRPYSLYSYRSLHRLADIPLLPAPVSAPRIAPPKNGETLIDESDEKSIDPRDQLTALQKAIESNDEAAFQAHLTVLEQTNPTLRSTLHRHLYAIHKENGLIKKEDPRYGRKVFANTTAEAQSLCRDLTTLNADRLEAINRTRDGLDK